MISHLQFTNVKFVICIFHWRGEPIANGRLFCPYQRIRYRYWHRETVNHGNYIATNQQKKTTTHTRTPIIIAKTTLGIDAMGYL